MNGAFSKSHPIVNFLFFISVTLFSMLYLHPIFLALSFLLAFSYSVKLKGFSAIKSFFTFILPMIAVITIINTAFSHYGVTILYTLNNGNNITLESIVNGAITGVMVCNVLLWFGCYNCIVTTDKFMYLFGKKFPSIALVISMALRFVPLYKNKLKDIAEAQKGIGMDYKSGNLIHRIKNGMKIISILITWSLENTIVTADSMKSRGYGLKNRTSFSSYYFNFRDIIQTIIILLSDVVVVLFIVTKDVYAVYNPVFDISNVNGKNVIAYIMFGILCAMPFVYDVLEDIKWNSLKSRI